MSTSSGRQLGNVLGDKRSRTPRVQYVRLVRIFKLWRESNDMQAHAVRQFALAHLES